MKIPLLCAGGAAFLILLIVIITKLAVSRANNGVSVNVQNSNTATNSNPSCPPPSPQGVQHPTLPIIPPEQPDYNYSDRDIEEILKKKGHHRTEFEADMVRKHSLRRKELQANQVLI